MTAPDYAARAAAGAVFLDGQIPGWAGQIDLDDLDVGSCYRCVLGQLDGDYGSGVEYLAIDGEDEVQLGFMRLAGEGGYAWQLLRNAWTAEITRRRETPKVTR